MAFPAFIIDLKSFVCWQSSSSFCTCVRWHKKPVFILHLYFALIKMCTLKALAWVSYTRSVSNWVALPCLQLKGPSLTSLPIIARDHLSVRCSGWTVSSVLRWAMSIWTWLTTTLNSQVALWRLMMHRCCDMCQSKISVHRLLTLSYRLQDNFTWSNWNLDQPYCVFRFTVE